MSSGAKLWTLLLAFCTASAAQAASEYRYTMIFDGHVGSEHITRIADDGSIATDFSYRAGWRRLLPGRIVRRTRREAIRPRAETAMNQDKICQRSISASMSACMRSLYSSDQ